MRRLFLGMLLTAASAFPIQLFNFGVKGGVPFNDAFNAASSGQIKYVTNAPRYTVGPELDINLPFGLGVEVDALYRRLNYSASGNAVDVFFQEAASANAWDIPILLKWRFTPGPIKPYVSVGPTFRGITNFKQRVSNFFGPGGEEISASELRDKFTTGFTLAAGLQLGSGHVRLMPEIRWVHWGWETFRSTPPGLLKLNPNQAEFLVGLVF